MLPIPVVEALAFDDHRQDLLNAALLRVVTLGVGDVLGVLAL